MKNIFSKILFLGILLTIFIACNENKKEKLTSEKKHITVWAWDKNFNVSIMEKAKKIYQIKHPDVEIKIIDYAKVDIETKLHTGLISGGKNGLPDITLIEDYNSKKFLTSYPGYFSNLKNDIDFNNFSPYKVKIMSDENGIYGVPFDSGVAGLFYRSDILEQAGFSPNDLENITWDRFIEIGKVVKEKTGKEMVSWDFLGDAGVMKIMLQSAGVWYFDSKGDVTIKNNPALHEAFRIMKLLYDTKVIKSIKGWGEWVGAFNKGDVASIITGVWIIPSIENAKDQSGKWRIAPIPRLNTLGSINSSNLGGSSWYVLEKSPNKEIAIDFLKSIYSENSDFYNEILVENGAIGTYIPSQKSPAYEKESLFFNNQKIYSDFSKLMRIIPSVDYGSFVGEADSAILYALKSVTVDNVSIDEALSKAEEEVISQVR